jgi:hypothetical protein
MSPMARAAHCSTVFSFNLQCPDHNRFTTHAGGIRTCGLHPCSFVRACCPHGAVREADCSYAWPTGFIAAHTRDEIEIGRRVISETRDPGFDLDVLYGDQHFCQTKSDALERVRHHIIMCTAPINSNSWSWMQQCSTKHQARKAAGGIHRAMERSDTML